MTLVPDEVVVGSARGAGLWIAPAGTPAPDDTDDFGDPWQSLGYASDDGVTPSGDTTTEQIRMHQSTTPVRTIVVERTVTLQFVLAQLNALTLGLYFDTEVDEPDEGDVLTFDVRSDAPALRHAIGVDVADGDKLFRLYYPRATLDTTGDMATTKSAIVPLDVTLSAQDDAGNLHSVQARTGRRPVVTVQPPPAITVPGPGVAIDCDVDLGVPAATHMWQVTSTDVWGDWPGQLDPRRFSTGTNISGSRVRCRYMNPLALIYTNECSVTITPGFPEVTQDVPAAVTANQGDPLGPLITCDFAGTPTPTHMWQMDDGPDGAWNDWPGRLNPRSFDFTATAGVNGKRVRCVYTNTHGTVMTGECRITVTPSDENGEEEPEQHG